MLSSVWIVHLDERKAQQLVWPFLSSLVHLSGPLEYNFRAKGGSSWEKSAIYRNAAWKMLPQILMTLERTHETMREMLYSKTLNSGVSFTIIIRFTATRNTSCEVS